MNVVVGMESAPGDYDGDGKADLVLYNVATATWRFRLSSAGYELFTTTF